MQWRRMKRSAAGAAAEGQQGKLTLQKAGSLLMAWNEGEAMMRFRLWKRAAPGRAVAAAAWKGGKCNLHTCLAVMFHTCSLTVALQPAAGETFFECADSLA